MNVAICLNENYVMPTAVMLNSLGYNNKNEEIVVFCVSCRELSITSKEILRTECEKYKMSISFFSYNLYNRKGFYGIEEGRWSIDAYLKLYLSEVIPSEIDKVLYLDGDCIVNSEIKELYETDISKYAFAAVRDAAEYDPLICKTILFDHGKFGYVNAGVLLLNLKYLI